MATWTPTSLCLYTRHAYSITVVLSGGVAPYIHNQLGGTLPSGMTYVDGSSAAGGGMLSGTPTAINESGTIQVNVVDNLGATTVVTIPFTVEEGDTFLPTSATGTVGVAITPITVTVAGDCCTGGTWAITNLPPGLSVNAATGVITGTPTVSGTYAVGLFYTDACGEVQIGTFTFTVSSAPLAFNATPVPSSCSTTGTSFTAHNFDASNRTGGNTPFTYTISAGAIPAGLALSTAGLLSGTPTATGTFSFTVRVTDGFSATATQSFTLTVSDPVALAATPAPQTTATNGAPITNFDFETATRSGGCAPITYSIVSGALPAGLTLSAAGILSGAPTASGTFIYTVRATDALSQAATRAFALTVGTLLQLAAVPAPASGAVGVNYAGHAFEVNRTGGIAPYTYQLWVFGALPPGLTLSTAGVLSGVPTADGAYNFSVQVIDSAGTVATRNYVIVIDATVTTLALAAAPAPTSSVTFNTPYPTFDFEAGTRTGGIAPYTYAISAGSLPTGLTLSSAGVLTGTPTVTDGFNSTVQVTDGAGQVATRAYTITVTGGPASLALSALPAPTAATVNTLYGGHSFDASNRTGGTAPYAYTISAGAIPTGLTLSTAGSLAGTPTTAGTYSFTVRVTDGIGLTATATYSLLVSEPINEATLTLTPTAKTLAPGGTFTPTVNVSGGSWTTTCGSVTALGLFTAPSVAGTCVATYITPGGQTASITYTIEPLLTITPTAVTIISTRSFQPVTNIPGTWTTTCGTVAASGFFTAPTTVVDRVCTATLTTPGGQTGTVVYTIEPLLRLIANTSPAAPGATRQITSNIAPTTYTATCGTVSLTGIWTAPANPGTSALTCVVTGTTLSGQTATITFVTYNGLVITAPTFVTFGGQTIQCTANTTAALDWFASLGAISATGLFTAPYVAKIAACEVYAVDAAGQKSNVLTFTIYPRLSARWEDNNATTINMRAQTTEALNAAGGSGSTEGDVDRGGTLTQPDQNRYKFKAD